MFLYEYGQRRGEDGSGVVQAMVLPTRISEDEFARMVGVCESETKEKNIPAAVKKVCRKLSFKYGFDPISYDWPHLTWQYEHGGQVIRNI